MRKIQKTIAISLVAMTAFSATSALAYADERPILISAPISTENIQKNFIGVYATVKEVTENSVLADVKYAGNEITSEVLLKVFDDTVIIDNENCEAISLKDIKKGDKIYAYHSLAQTKSIPPQTNAFVIATNLKNEMSVPTLIDVSKITTADDATKALSADNEYVISFTKDTNMTAYLTKNKITYKDVKEGDRILAWFDIATMSLPAQATALKAVVLPKEEIKEEIKDEEATEENITVCEFIRIVVTNIVGELPTPMDTHYATAYMNKAKELGITDGNKYSNQDTWNKKISRGEAKKILKNVEKLDMKVDMDKLNAALKDVNIKSVKVNGKELKNAETIVRNGKVMVPLRAVCEELGFEINWDEKTNSCEINNGEVKSTLRIGYDSYFKATAIKKAVGLTAPQKYGVPPTLLNSKTYIPAEFFNLMYSNPEAVKVEDGTLNINK